MSELPIENVENEKRVEAVGVRILGESDPRKMSRDEFEQSPDLLFHGSSKPMRFSQEFDYRSHEYLTENDGSATLGFGFYSTDDREEAENYSIVRQNYTGEPIVVCILPFRARVLDLRQKNNLEKNAPVPREFASAWKERFLCYLKTRPPREGNIGEIFNSLEQEYAQYLDRVLALPAIDLRVLLGTAPSRQVKGPLNLPSPPWVMLFSDFMLERGYDGLVYNEGGEGPERRGGASFVFYNLKKIGTYESWHEKEG